MNNPWINKKKGGDNMENELLKSKFIFNLHTSKKTSNDYIHFICEVSHGRYREFTKDDSNKTGIRVAMIVTKGKGKREIFQEILHCYGDTGKISNSIGNIYLYGRDGLDYPRRFKITSHRLLVDTQN